MLRFNGLHCCLAIALATTGTANAQNAPPAHCATKADESMIPLVMDQREGAPLFKNLGAHHMPITTSSADAQKFFDQGITLVYAFNHPEAIRSLREAARLDPKAPMPWWGIAFAYGPNINRPMFEGDVARAWEAITKARELAANGTDRERAYIEALAKRYQPSYSEDRSALDKAFADAMRDVAAKYPDDLDAATFYAEALMDTMPWDYWQKDGEPKPDTKLVLAELERVLEANPDHPGANHYYIHAVEAAKPELGLAAADRLGSLVAAAGHLVHMPAHIYLRLGMYHLATVANERAEAADQSYLAQCNAQGFYPATYYPHNVHFLWYTNAMDGCSKASLDAARRIRKLTTDQPASEGARLRPLLTMALVRFGQWDEVLEQPRPDKQRIYEYAIDCHGRGLALAAKGKLDEAQRELDELRKLAADESNQSLDTIVLPGYALIKLAERDLAGHIALARGEHDAAIAALRGAAQMEDELPYMEPPFSYIPMRHGLGAALLKANRAQEAEKVYRDDLKRHPNNGWALLGLVQSLRAQGKDEVADAVQSQLDLAWIRADVKPPSSRY